MIGIYKDLPFLSYFARICLIVNQINRIARRRFTHITDPEKVCDTNGDGKIDGNKIAGDANGDGKITSPEIAGDTNGNSVITFSEILGDTNGDGHINENEIAEKEMKMERSIQRKHGLLTRKKIIWILTLTDAIGYDVVFIKKYDPVLNTRYEEINDLFQKHFHINIPKDCSSLKEIIALTNQLHFNRSQWYDSFVASIMDIWKAYEEQANAKKLTP